MSILSIARVVQCYIIVNKNNNNKNEKNEKNEKKKINTR
jgi:hypothetical protein